MTDGAGDGISRTQISEIGAELVRFREVLSSDDLNSFARRFIAENLDGSKAHSSQALAERAGAERRRASTARAANFATYASVSVFVAAGLAAVGLAIVAALKLLPVDAEVVKTVFKTAFGSGVVASVEAGARAVKSGKD